jgi:hypothetical protein
MSPPHPRALQWKLLPHPRHQPGPRNPRRVVREGLLIRVTTASCSLPVVRMPARRGFLPLADVPYRGRRDGGTELVIRCKHPVIPVPLLPRRRHEIRQPVETLKRRQLDHAVGPRPRGLPPASRADPVGGFVSGEHLADTGDAAVCVAIHRESLHRKRRPGAIQQQVV